jgi:cytochrome c biogenesis protein CcdA
MIAISASRRPAINTANDLPEKQIPSAKRSLLKKALVRLWPFLIALAIVLFPFDWLTEVWPAYRQVFDRVFVTARDHAIGHSTLFFLLGLFALVVSPALRKHPLLYLGLMLLVMLGQEALQSIFKQELPNIFDGRDILFDLLGVIVAFAVMWTWQWVRNRISLPG